MFARIALAALATAAFLGVAQASSTGIDAGKHGVHLDQGKYGANTEDGNYGRNLDEGKLGADTDETPPDPR